MKKNGNGTPTDEAMITIRIKKSADMSRWTSTHEFDNLDPITAACILLDIGRDILLASIHHHQTEDFHGD